MEVEQAKHHGVSTSKASKKSHKINKVHLLLQNPGLTVLSLITLILNSQLICANLLLFVNIIDPYIVI